MHALGQQTSVQRASVLDVPVDLVTMESALAFIEERIRTHEPSTVVTLDAAGVMLARESSDFLEIVRRAELVTPDSVGILWALRRKDIHLPSTVSGVNLMGQICALSADQGYRVYLLGAAPGVAELAAERLRLRYPGCNIVGARHGFFPEDSDEVVAREVAATKPDVLLVAMGMPAQERFITRTRGIIGAPVAIGVGGSFDVFSGKTKRAPRWVQRLRLEWLWRVILNPRKMTKVKALPKFVLAVLRDRS